MAEMTSRIIDRDGGAGKGLEVGDDRDRFGAGALGLVPDRLDQRERWTSASLPPSCARRSATVRPMPWAAPVTTAILPAKRCAKIISFSVRPVQMW